MQHFTLPVGQADASHKISSVLLRDDGQIHCVVDGKECLAENQPNNVRQIALAIDGLACLDKRGQLYHWNADTQQSRWTPDNSQKRVHQILCLADGRLCVTKGGQAFVRDGDTWEECSDVSQWLGLVKRPSRMRFGLRSLLALAAVVALALGPITSIRRSKQRTAAIQILESQGCEIYYAHELDSNGDLIDDPIEPGIDWLKSLTGPEPFLTPVRLVQSRGDDVIDASQLHHLTMLRELSIRSSRFDDLSAIRNMNQLVKLDCWSIKDYSPIQNLTQLKELTSTVENLQQISQLKNLETITTTAEDLSSLTSFPKLRRLNASWSKGFQPIPDLVQLKHLRLYGYGVDASELRQLTQLETLIVSASNVVEDLDWVRDMKKLRHLSVDASKPLQNTTAALMQLPELERVYLPEGTRLDVPLLQTHPKLELKRISVDHSSILGQATAKLQDCNLTDLSFLAGYNELRTLDVSNNHIVDIKPLGTLIALNYVTLDGNPISDISPLESCSLSGLSLNDTQVTDLTPIRSLGHVDRLSLAGLPIDDKQVAQNILSTSSLDLSRTRISNLQWLKDLLVTRYRMLTRLVVADTLVQDLGPLEFHSELDHLNLSGTKVSDIQVLGHLSELDDLNLQGTMVTDISPLKHLELDNLSLANTNVTDISALIRSSDMEYLDLSATKTDDFSIINELTSICQLNLSQTSFSDLTLLPESYQAYALDLRGCKIGQWNAADLNEISLTRLMFSAGAMARLDFASEFAQVQMIVVDDLRPHHDLNDLPLKKIQTLSLSGEPITHFSWLARATLLQWLRLPKGTVVDKNDLIGLPALKSVYVGDERVWGEPFSFDDHSKIEWKNIQ